VCSKVKLPYVVGGDFNILRFSSEKNRRFQFNRFSDIFNTIINTHGLRELANAGGGIHGLIIKITQP
jgi:hypothetical protein